MDFSDIETIHLCLEMDRAFTVYVDILWFQQDFINAHEYSENSMLLQAALVGFPSCSHEFSSTFHSMKRIEFEELLSDL